MIAADRGDRAALITMPTGTGKTGVIATTVTVLPSVVGHRLVLSPWDALVDQLIGDLRGRFWSRLPANERPAPPPVRRLPSSSDVERIQQTEEPTVFVATIAAISVLARRAAELDYDPSQVFSGFGCVIVDEGHYEPAPQWSQAIRALRRPTILLTATPYRNDLKYFHIGNEWRFRFPHHAAEEHRFVRTPILRTVDGPDPVQFARSVVRFMEQELGKDSDARVIIRCRDSDRIRAIVRALEHLGHDDVLGVHERFPAGGDRLLREVPSTDFPARYWIHQNKLIEGIDDPRFKVLAFYDALRNDRAIVQQIGRVLRNPDRDPANMTAFVLGRGDRDLERTWNAYRQFDRQPEAESVATLPNLVNRVLEAQPEAFYYEGGYRTKLDLDDPSTWRDFAYRLRTRVYRAATKPIQSLESIAKAVADEWSRIDRSVFSTQVPEDGTVIIPYVTAANSPLLRTGTFIEPEFGYTFIHRSRDLLFLYDARGATPEIIGLNYRPLRPDELQSLLPNRVSSLTSVSLLNTDIGRQAARSRQVRAAAIDELAPDLADYAFVCSIAEGYTEIEDQRVRRYLGLNRSRITDHRATELDYGTYRDWLKTLETQLRGGAKAASTFDRYAQLVPTPSDPSPVHVLLDIDPASFHRLGDSTSTPLELEETAIEVGDGKLEIVANGASHAATLTWDPATNRYHLESPSLRDELFVEDSGEARELVSFINEEQALRVVPATRTAIYSHGHFFKPVVPLRKAGAFQLLDVLHPVDELGAMASEKGDAIVGDDWSPDCVFGFITALDPSNSRSASEGIRRLLDQPDMLLCTDLGTEVADFIGTQRDRVVFMHAKASTKPRHYSASALHDIASQAIKNLLYLQPLAEIRPPMGTWVRPWKHPSGNGQTRRLRVGTYSSAAEMWSRVREVTSTPTAEREVWLILGQSLSKEELRRQAERSRSKRAPEALQVFSLLQTTWGAVSQLGARLRIFCSP